MDCFNRFVSSLFMHNKRTESDKQKGREKWGGSRKRLR